MLKKIKDSLRTRLRSWLDVDLADANAKYAADKARSVERRLADLCTPAADVHFRGNTQIVVISRIRDGRVQFYDLNVRDPRELAERMAHICGPAWPDGIIDAPIDFVRAMKRGWR